jgi:hypothetical protein
MFALLREVQILYMNYEDTRATGPNCIPTARNESCAREGELPGDDGLYGGACMFLFMLAVDVCMCVVCALRMFLRADDDAVRLVVLKCVRCFLD